MISDEKLVKQIKDRARENVVRSFEYDDILDGVARGVVHAKIGQLKAIEILHNRSDKILERVFSDNNTVATQNPIVINFEKSDNIKLKDGEQDNQNIPPETVGSVTE